MWEKVTCLISDHPFSLPNLSDLGLVHMLCTENSRISIICMYRSDSPDQERHRYFLDMGLWSKCHWLNLVSLCGSRTPSSPVSLACLLEPRSPNPPNVWLLLWTPAPRSFCLFSALSYHGFLCIGMLPVAVKKMWTKNNL